MVKLLSVRLAVDKATPIVEHNDGIKVAGNATQSFVNVSDGSRKGVKRPFVLLELEELDVDAKNGGHKEIVVYWGNFTDNGRIVWNARIAPSKYQEALVATKSGNIGFDHVRTVLEMNDVEMFEELIPINSFKFVAKAAEYGVKVKSAGAFVSLPDEDGQFGELLADLSVRPYIVPASGVRVEKDCTFIFAEDLKTRAGILKNFAARGRVIWDVKKKEDIYNPDMLEMEMASRQASPEETAKVIELETLRLPSNEERAFLKAADDAFDAAENLAGIPNRTPEQEKAFTEAKKAQADAIAKANGAKEKRFARMAELKK